MPDPENFEDDRHAVGEIEAAVGREVSADEAVEARASADHEDRLMRETEAANEPIHSAFPGLTTLLIPKRRGEDFVAVFDSRNTIGHYVRSGTQEVTGVIDKNGRLILTREAEDSRDEEPLEVFGDVDPDSLVRDLEAANLGEGVWLNPMEAASILTALESGAMAEVQLHQMHEAFMAVSNRHEAAKRALLEARNSVLSRSGKSLESIDAFDYEGAVAARSALSKAVRKASNSMAIAGSFLRFAIGLLK